MRSHEQKHLAGILEECSKRLEDALEQLGFEGPSHAQDGAEDRFRAQNGAAAGANTTSQEPENPLASIDAVAKRVIDVENALREDMARRQRRSLRTTLRQWTSPRLGILRHHMPEPLRVPTRYLRTAAPREAPTISIVTPSYEQGRYLERTIYSVLNQNYPGLEYVVQDGGSRDETREVLEHFDEPLSHWASEPDDGQADAINRGFAHTKGEIMAYLNSDDLLLPGSLAYVARYFAAHPRVDAVYGHRILIDENDGQIGVWVTPRHDDQILTYADYIPQETLFWRRELWEKAGARIDTSLKFAVDWDLLLRFREAGAHIVRLPRFLGAFRVHDEQKTGNQQRLCDEESDRLRQRVLGRTMGDEEVYARVRPYLRRHVVHHTMHRLRERLPQQRSHVRTLPLEAAVKREEISPFDMR
jgi:glycosyltransferase involved in cell wall biosynthesis